MEVKNQFLENLLKIKSDISEHLELFYDTCIEKNAQMVVELGVRLGNSTRVFMEACKITGGKLISVDKDDCSWISGLEDWIFIQADSTKIRICTPIDILLIDSSHDYNSTTIELKNLLPMIKKDGVVFMHDTNCQDVKNAIFDYLKKDNTWNLELKDNCGGLGILTKR